MKCYVTLHVYLALVSITPLLATSYPSSDIPKAISSSGTPTVTSIINVPASADTITDVNITLDITHSWDDDLDITLIHPDGTRIELSTDNGGSNDHYTNTAFDQQAATSITSGSAPFTGTFRPEGNLDSLNGKTATGNWTLEIHDDANNDGGSLNSWSLDITTTNPDLDNDGLLDLYVVNGMQATSIFPDLQDGLLVEENQAFARFLTDRINRMDGPVRFLLPEGGVSALDAPGQPFEDTTVRNALFAAIESCFEETAHRQLIRVPHHINDPEFAQAALAALRALPGCADLEWKEATSETAGDLALEIILENMSLTMEDLILCFNYAKRGIYGELYNRIDGQVIKLWLNEYSKARTAQIMEFQYKKEVAAKEINRTVGEQANYRWFNPKSIKDAAKAAGAEG